MSMSVWLSSQEPTISVNVDISASFRLIITLHFTLQRKFVYTFKTKVLIITIIICIVYNPQTKVLL